MDDDGMEVQLAQLLNITVTNGSNAAPDTMLAVDTTTGGDGDGGAAAAAVQREHRQESERVPAESALKFLVPNNLAGSLIGKAGATIKHIQQQASCMVRIATSGMYFPGTMERAVLVAGDTHAVKAACVLILHTIHRPNKGAVSGAPCSLDPEEAIKIEITQRLLIPLSAGGLVIGRKGANIAALLKGSGAKVTLGQKSEVKASERIVTIMGTLPAATKATEMLVDKLQEEPNTSRFVNMSVNYRGQGHYNQAAAAAGIAPPSARSLDKSAASGGDNVDAADSSHSAAASSSATDAHETMATAGSPSPSQGSRCDSRGAGVAGGVARGSGHSQLQPQYQQQHQHLPPWLPNAGARAVPPQSRPSSGGHTHQQIRQMASMSPPPAAHQQQLLGMTPGGPMPPTPPPSTAGTDPMTTGTPTMVGGGGLPLSPLEQAAVHRMGVPYAHRSLPPGAVYHPGMQGPPGVLPAAAAATGVVPRGFPSPQIYGYEPMTNPVAMAIAACQPTTTVSVGVPDSMVGAILGRGGATINELQSVSGARITISQRDDLVPGTEDRILTISGTAMATQTAQYLVSQKIQAVASNAAERPRRRGDETS